MLMFLNYEQANMCFLKYIWIQLHLINFNLLMALFSKPLFRNKLDIQNDIFERKSVKYASMCPSFRIPIQLLL